MNITIIVGDFPHHLNWPAFERRLRRAILQTYSPAVRSMRIGSGIETFIGINGNHQPDEAFRIFGLIEESIACTMAVE